VGTKFVICSGFCVVLKNKKIVMELLQHFANELQLNWMKEIKTLYFVAGELS